jgi:hypothetical protein
MFKAKALVSDGGDMVFLKDRGGKPVLYVDADYLNGSLKKLNVNSISLTQFQVEAWLELQQYLKNKDW